MSLQLLDGRGSGRLAEVDSFHRLRTLAVTRLEEDAANRDGLSFNINTGTISLTSDNESGLLYVKNNNADIVNGSSRLLFIHTLFAIFGASTGGANEGTLRIVRNPSAGTLISGATTADMPGVNRNFGSSVSLDADVFKGAEGNTVTDGTDFLQSLIGASTRVPLGLGVILEKGSSIAVLYDPPAGNTAMSVQVAMSVHMLAVE